jgi:hypothetical protein
MTARCYLIYYLVEYLPTDERRNVIQFLLTTTLHIRTLFLSFHIIIPHHIIILAILIYFTNNNAIATTLQTLWNIENILRKKFQA